jgi:hypothetical protein
MRSKEMSRKKGLSFSLALPIIKKNIEIKEKKLISKNQLDRRR